MFTIPYDAKALHGAFPMLSLTAHEGRWEELADEVAINLLAVGNEPRCNTVTLIARRCSSAAVRCGRSTYPWLCATMEPFRNSATDKLCEDL